ncbi:S41 family peptidase [Sphingosinicella sp. LHD-64]|uniref:S41 family peptidase n=1 Tax=Sphingosinicella sp. LHD-64 TaxID=3072139 RepID=UPI00280EF355|nr:S41 family peptidase [Sphingosinicella sp. LHD-64]MDQ8755906.1 S41 family peptidase [Sphingosinicella sp. LHD-64]
MIPRTLVAAIAALTPLAPAPALAQRAAPTAVARSDALTALTVEQRTAAIEAIIAAVREKYVFPDRVPVIEARLRASLANGRYTTESPGNFAERVTEDLRESSQDRHMYVNVDPAQYRLAVAATGAPEEDPAMAAYWRRLAVRSNHGLRDMRILPGNVRYLKVAGFNWVDDESGAAYDAAARFLRDGDAIVIDLRGNGGGSHGAVNYLISHFLAPNRLEMTFLQGGETPSQSRSLGYLPAGRLTGRPLYVLIDGRTGSAAEAFAYDVQQFRLGRLVGAKTGGAANNNGFTPIAPGFMLSVSFGRPVHAVSQSNWEGVGVSPDVAVAPQQALDTALSLALADLEGRTGADAADRADWAWARSGIEARLHPVAVPADRLRPLAGTYGSNRVVFRDGALWLERADRPTARLMPMTSDGLFLAEGYDDALRLRLTGPAMEIMWIDEPASRTVPRSAD